MLGVSTLIGYRLVRRLRYGNARAAHIEQVNRQP
jgi:hypothetical protein